jgi:protein involved in polysaccharide export with SLBB domain
VAEPILAPGDVLRVVSDADAAVEIARLVVTEGGTVEVPDLGVMPVTGYTVEDLAAVWTSVRPEVGAVRVVRVRPRHARSSRPPRGAEDAAPAG